MADLTEVETKIAFLERHIEEQDAEIYRQAQQLERLQKALIQLKERFETRDNSASGDLPENERPPHY